VGAFTYKMLAPRRAERSWGARIRTGALRTKTARAADYTTPQWPQRVGRESVPHDLARSALLLEAVDNAGGLEIGALQPGKGGAQDGG
jgi:hypothetical protein